MLPEAQSSRGSRGHGPPSNFRVLHSQKYHRILMEDLFATATIPGTNDDETPRESASSKHLSVSIPFRPAKRCRSSRKRNTCCPPIRLAAAGQTNSHVVPVGQDGGRDSRSAGGALRSNAGGGGGGEGADPSGGTHPGGTRKRAEHGGGTYRRFIRAERGREGRGAKKGVGVFEHKRGKERGSGEIRSLLALAL